MAEWVLLTQQDDYVVGLGEFLARSVPGEWQVGTDGSLEWYAFRCTLDSQQSSAWLIAQAVADYLLNVADEPWLRQMLHRRYQRLSEVDEQTLIQGVVHDLHSDPEHNRDRVELAATLIVTFLEEHDVLVFDGVRTFLLPEIRQEFEETLDQAVDHFFIEQEYREFVGLLRAFVSNANGRWDLVHVWMDSHPFHFEDGEGQRVGEDIVSDLAMGAVQEGTQDDLLVSALITLAPRRVVVHRGRLQREALRTIQAVFEERVSFCRDCARCRRDLTDRRLLY